jgi:hypothetical protein
MHVHSMHHSQISPITEQHPAHHRHQLPPWELLLLLLLANYLHHPLPLRPLLLLALEPPAFDRLPMHYAPLRSPLLTALLLAQASPAQRRLTPSLHPQPPHCPHLLPLSLLLPSLQLPPDHQQNLPLLLLSQTPPQQHHPPQQLQPPS